MICARTVITLDVCAVHVSSVSMMKVMRTALLGRKGLGSPFRAVSSSFPSNHSRFRVVVALKISFLAADLNAG